MCKALKASVLWLCTSTRRAMVAVSRFNLGYFFDNLKSTCNLSRPCKMVCGYMWAAYCFVVLTSL